jgi:predicted nucleic acid-binding protein
VSETSSSEGTARVFDSWALIAFLENEASAPKVKALFAEAQETRAPLFVSTVNLGEVWYSTARASTEAKADAVVDVLLALGFQVVPADWELSREAARFKAKHKIAFGDCFAAALAKLRGLEVVTGDPEFKQLAREVKILRV